MLAIRWYARCTAPGLSNLDLEQVFGVFGVVRQTVVVEVDATGRPTEGISLHAKVYVQYHTHAGFKCAMGCFGGRVLSWQKPGADVTKQAVVTATFDSTGYLSAKALKRRTWDVEDARRKTVRAAEEVERVEKRRIAAEEATVAAEERRKKEDEAQEERAMKEYDERKAVSLPVSPSPRLPVSPSPRLRACARARTTGPRRAVVIDESRMCVSLRCVDALGAGRRCIS